MYSDSLNPYGLLDGKLVTVNDVPSGASCGCLCPQCKQPLIAKKGSQNLHHFAHLTKTGCSGSLETALHIKAKDIFVRHNHIILPAVPGQIGKKVFTPIPEEYRRFLMIDSRYRVTHERPVNKFEYNDVFIESTIDELRPDIILSTDSGPFIVEIYVTHKTGIHKIHKIKSLGILGIEIDLRYLRRLDILDEKLIENAVIHCAHTKRWLSI